MHDLMAVLTYPPVLWTIVTVAQILAVMIVVLISLAFLLLADRKIWA
ncbi:NADH-quinone oxidoreductase subunit H, partial [Pseudomonas sp. FW300-E2]